MMSSPVTGAKKFPGLKKKMSIGFMKVKAAGKK